jgi:hypothetical protein
VRVIETLADGWRRVNALSKGRKDNRPRINRIKEALDSLNKAVGADARSMQVAALNAEVEVLIAGLGGSDAEMPAAGAAAGGHDIAAGLGVPAPLGKPYFRTLFTSLEAFDSNMPSDRRDIAGYAAFVGEIRGRVDKFGSDIERIIPASESGWLARFEVLQAITRRITEINVHLGRLARQQETASDDTGALIAELAADILKALNALVVRRLEALPDQLEEIVSEARALTKLVGGLCAQSNPGTEALPAGPDFGQE